MPVSTINRDEATDLVRTTWERLQDVLSNEEGWAILQDALHSYQPNPLRKQCYLAGPMRGYPDFNRKAFFEAEDRLIELGWSVWNPARFDLDDESPDVYPMDHYVRRDIGLLCSLRPNSDDAIITLPRWWLSIGASAEVAVAKWLKVRHIPYLAAQRLGLSGS